MSDDSPTVVSDDARYTPRAVDDEEWIEGFLDRQPSGVVGLVDDGAPYLVTQLYVYDPEGGAIFFHSADEGRTKRVVERSDDVCFAVSRMGRLLPAEKPVNFSVEYESVVAFGRVRLLDDRAEKRHALELFMDKFTPQLTPGRDYEPMADASIDRTAVYRIDVEEWSAKRNDQPDHPGAYEYDAVRE